MSTAFRPCADGAPRLTVRAARRAAAALIALALCALGLAAPAAAGDLAKAFPSVNQIEVRGFVGRIEVAARPGEAGLVLTEGTKGETPTISAVDGVLTISSPTPDKDKFVNVKKKLSRRGGIDRLADYLDGFATLKLTAPAAAKLRFDETLAVIFVDDGFAQVEIDGGLVDAMVGDAGRVKALVSYSGRASFGVIDGPLHAKVAGSGDLFAKSAGEARLKVAGSGDVKIGDLRGPATAGVYGSGDIRMGAIDGMLKATVKGSGDIVVDSARGGEFSVSGSGDVKIGMIDGPVTATVAGSGDIAIKDGAARDLVVAVTGSGGFDFGGASTNLDASVNGSGDVVVARNEGALSTSGRGGDIKVNGKDVKRGDD